MELVREAFISHLEFSSIVFDVVYLEDRNRRTFEDMDRLDDQLLALFSRSLFDWCRAWDSHLVILSLCSLALSFFVISASFLFFCLFLYCLICFVLLCI